MVQLDRTNLRLVELLQRNARASISDLARVVNRGESTVRERLMALERDGVILGYHAIVDPAKLGFGTRAVVRAEADLRAVPELVRALASVPNILEAHLTTGPKPLRLELMSRDLPSLEALIEKRLAHLPMTGLETSVVMQTFHEHRPVPTAAVSPASAGTNGQGEDEPAVESIGHHTNGDREIGPNRRLPWTVETP